jgi:hypothetical protein
MGEEPSRSQVASDHERAAAALEEAARAHESLAVLWECSGENERAAVERQLAHEAAQMAKREQELARRAGAAGKTAAIGPSKAQTQTSCDPTSPLRRLSLGPPPSPGRAGAGPGRAQTGRPAAHRLLTAGSSGRAATLVLLVPDCWTARARIVGHMSQDQDDLAREQMHLAAARALERAARAAPGAVRGVGVRRGRRARPGRTAARSRGDTTCGA